MLHYVSLLSEVSDVVHKNQIEVDAYVKIAQKYSGKILELGSGTGCLSLELAKNGYDVTCLEIHRDMIHLHREKLTEETKGKTTLVLGDMCAFDLGHKFDLIIAPNSVIQYIMNTEEFHDMLISVKSHLTDVGMFIIESKLPNISIMKQQHGIETIHEFINPRNNNVIEERVTPFFNFTNQIKTKKEIMTEFKNSRIKRRVEIMSEQKFWYAKDIRSMINKSNLSVIIESGSLKNIEPLTDESSDMVFYIKK